MIIKSFKLILYLAVLGQLLVCCQLSGQDRSSTTNQILLLEQERFKAMIEVDTTSLDTILSDDLTYTHTSGWTQSKAELMVSLTSGQLNYQSAITSEVVVRVYGKTAVVTGKSHMKVESGGQEYDLLIRFIDVYVKSNGDWQMVAWQSTKL